MPRTEDERPLAARGWPGGTSVWAVVGAAALTMGAIACLAHAMRPAVPSRAAHGIARSLYPRGVAVEPAAPSLAPVPVRARCEPEPPLPPRSTDFPPPLELARLVRDDPKSLGSASIGTPTRGALWGGVELTASEGIETAGDHPWGTEGVVRSIERAVREVRRCHPGAPKLHVGDISRKEGGWLRPHRSHQSGLDADLGYYYLDPSTKWFTHATAANLDRVRTWALVRALIDGGNVEAIFMDRSVQALLREHIETIEEDRPRLEGLFEQDPKKHDGIIHHVRGHATHFHVRFRDPASVALGVRLSPMLGKARLNDPAKAAARPALSEKGVPKPGPKKAPRKGPGL